MAAYQAALADAPRIEIAAARTKPGTVDAAVACYFGSAVYERLARETQAMRRRILEAFREAHGHRNFAQLGQKHVLAMLTGKSPHAARNFLKVLRALVAASIAAGLREDDPTAGIRAKVPASGGFETWTEDHIAQFEAAHPIGSRARLAFDLLLWTGQRRSDVVRMGRQHVKDGFLRVRQSKTGAELEIPVAPALAASIGACRGEHLTFLTTKDGKPFAPAGFGNWFRDECRAAGLPAGLSAHGLRKAACRRLAEAGCTASQIQAISGHRTLGEVQRYTKAADQKKLASAAMQTLRGEHAGNKKDKPPLSKTDKPL